MVWLPQDWQKSNTVLLAVSFETTARRQEQELPSATIDLQAVGKSVESSVDFCRFGSWAAKVSSKLKKTHWRLAFEKQNTAMVGTASEILPISLVSGSSIMPLALLKWCNPVKSVRRQVTCTHEAIVSANIPRWNPCILRGKKAIVVHNNIQLHCDDEAPYRHATSF